ncbi:MAG TPA: hypothetical protein ENG66_01050 [Thermococcus sp.]|nr:hypothetical protein [Thermococcus sp.]
MRWITFLGRTGTVLLAISLALALVSLIPPATYSTPIHRFVDGGMYEVVWSGRYTPKLGLSISIRSNGSVYLYFLSVSSFQFYNWTMTWAEENLQDPYYRFNITVLNEFLKAHPDDVLWNCNFSSGEDVFYEFIPTSVVNVTVVIANPSSNLVEVEGEIREIVTVSPRKRTLTLTQILASIGIVLVVPWAISMRRK